MQKFRRLTKQPVVVIPDTSRHANLDVPPGFVKCYSVMQDDLSGMTQSERDFLQIKQACTNRRVVKNENNELGWISGSQVAADLSPRTFILGSDSRGANVHNKYDELRLMEVNRQSFLISLPGPGSKGSFKQVLQYTAYGALTAPYRLFNAAIFKQHADGWARVIAKQCDKIKKNPVSGTLSSIFMTPLAVILNPLNTQVMYALGPVVFGISRLLLYGITNLVHKLRPEKSKSDEFDHALRFSLSTGKALYLKPNAYSGGGRGVMRLSFERNGEHTSMVLDTPNTKLLDGIASHSPNAKRDPESLTFDLPGEGPLKAASSLLREILSGPYRQVLGLDIMKTLIAEEEIDLVPFRGQKAEIRFVFLKRNDTVLRCVADYCKAGSNSITANIADGGAGVKTREMISECFPGSSAETVEAIYENSLYEAESAISSMGRRLKLKAAKSKITHPLTSELPILCSVDVGLQTPVNGQDLDFIDPAVIELNSIFIGLSGLKSTDPEIYTQVLQAYSEEVTSYLASKLGPKTNSA